MNPRLKRLIITGFMLVGVGLIGSDVMANSQVVLAARATDGCVVSAGVKVGATSITDTKKGDTIDCRKAVGPRIRISGHGGDDMIWGSDVGDVLRGDSIKGGGGNDTIYAMGGNDVVRGGSSDDRIHGGSGDDKCYGDSHVNKDVHLGECELVKGFNP